MSKNKQTLSRQDQELLKLGQMVFGMISDVLVLPSSPSDIAFAQRGISMPNGIKVTLMVMRDQELVELVNRAIECNTDVTNVSASTGNQKAN